MAEDKKTKGKPRGKPFQKGVSGNPSGRPKLPKEFVKMAREKSVVALEYLINTISDENVQPQVRVRAAETVIAYGYGKPSQTIDLSAGDKKAIKVSVKYE